MRLFILLIGVCAAVIAPAAEIELSPVAAGSAIDAAVGDVLVVRVQGNASTGYAWERIDDGLGILVQERGVPVRGTAPERPERIGGATAQVWRFRALKPGETTLRLDYRQPWVKDVPPAREVAWVVRVR